MLRVREFSDLHVEFMTDESYCGTEVLIPELPMDDETILVLAGDIGMIHKHRTNLIRLLTDTCKRFRAVLYVVGNHEHYKGSLIRTIPKIKDATKKLSNLHVLQNESIEFDGVVFIGATLWTDMRKGCPVLNFDARRGMSDFRVIRTGSLADPYAQKFTPNLSIVEHLKSKQYIFEEVVKQREAGKKTVVITHHAPSWKSVADEYIGNSLNGCYVSDLSEELFNMGPDYWFHGHVHSSFDYDMGPTRVMCNPRGYPNEGQEEYHMDKLVIKI